jgi:Cd2+/Zn2+-exporting ATPase
MAKAAATYRLENLDCAVCAANLEFDLRKSLRPAASIEFARCPQYRYRHIDAVAARISQLEPGVRVNTGAERRIAGEGPSVRFGSYSLPRRRVIVFAVAAGLWGLGIAAGFLAAAERQTLLRLLPFVAAYVLAGSPVLRDAFRNILRGKALDENFLMSVATIGAFAVGEWGRPSGS